MLNCNHCCFKSVNTERKPERCILMASICETCKGYFNKTPSELIKHVHFRFPSVYAAIVRRPTSFLDFDCQSTYILDTDPYNELFYNVALLILDEEQSEQDLTTL